MTESQMVLTEIPRKSPSDPPNSATRDCQGQISSSLSTLAFEDENSQLFFFKCKIIDKRCFQHLDVKVKSPRHSSTFFRPSVCPLRFVTYEALFGPMCIGPNLPRVQRRPCILKILKGFHKEVNPCSMCSPTWFSSQCNA